MSEDFERKGADRYGAWMGRASDLPIDTTSTCRIVRVPLDKDGYDKGGAYWGTPNNLFQVLALDGRHEGLCRYMRASANTAVMAAMRDVKAWRTR